MDKPSDLEFNNSWLALATSAAATAAAFAAAAASSAMVGFGLSVFSEWSFSSTTLQIQDFNLGTTAFCTEEHVKLQKIRIIEWIKKY